MTRFDRERLNRYLTDVEKWLVVIAEGLQHPETPAQVEAASMTREAIELLADIRQQINTDGGQ